MFILDDAELSSERIKRNLNKDLFGEGIFSKPRINFDPLKNKEPSNNDENFLGVYIPNNHDKYSHDPHLHELFSGKSSSKSSDLYVPFKHSTPTHKEADIKRRPEMDSNGFYGDTFSSGFGDFYTMKKKDQHQQKRRPEMDSNGFYGDTFSSGFGDFYTMKKRSAAPSKRRPEMDSSGFYGDTFSQGFGDFYTMKRASKRRPEMDSKGFYGDTFNSGFGDFYTMKRNANSLNNLRMLLNSRMEKKKLNALQLNALRQKLSPTKEGQNEFSEK